MSETMLAKRELALVRLTREQEQAATLVAEGRAASEAAREVEIDAETIAAWQADPRFVAEVNRRGQAAWSGVQDRLRSLVSRAVDALEEAVDRGDVRAAVEVLKAAGVYGNVGAPRGETDPELVMVRQAEAWAETELAKQRPVTGETDWVLTDARGERRAKLVERRLNEVRSGGA